MCGCHGMIHGHQEAEPVQTPTTTPTVTQPGRACPNCGYGLRDDFGFCPRCGLRLSPLGTCRYCGRALEPDWTTCPSCGASPDTLHRIKVKYRGQRQGGIEVEGHILY